MLTRATVIAKASSVAVQMAKLMEDQESDDEVESAPSYMQRMRVVVDMLEADVDDLEEQARELQLKGHLA